MSVLCEECGNISSSAYYWQCYAELRNEKEKAEARVKELEEKIVVWDNEMTELSKWIEKNAPDTYWAGDGQTVVDAISILIQEMREASK
jgi:hypothetical protein